MLRPLRLFGLLLAAVMLCAGLSAEDAQRPLDPSRPMDAVQIIHALTEKMVLPRDQAVALTQSIQTLAKLAQESAAPPRASIPGPAPEPTAAPAAIPAPSIADPKKGKP